MAQQSRPLRTRPRRARSRPRPLAGKGWRGRRTGVTSWSRLSPTARDPSLRGSGASCQTAASLPCSPAALQACAKVRIRAPFAGATHVVLSPDRAHLATDTDGGLWIADADGPHGHRLDLGVARGCVLAQFAWLGESAGLAYITLCMSQTSTTSKNKIAPITYHATLSTVSASGGSSRTLLRAGGKTQTVLDLAPAYGCLACG